MSKYTVLAFHPDGTEILGNGNGQGIIVARKLRRTNHYKRLVHGMFRGTYSHGKPYVHSYEIRQGNLLIERITFND